MKINTQNILSRTMPVVVPTVVFALILLACEFFFGLLLPQNAGAPPHSDPAILQPHPVLGSEIRKEDGAHPHAGYRKDGTLWEVTYTLEKGRRYTPVTAPERRDKFFACFGCSFVFGWGNADHETLPARLAVHAPEYTPYNFGDIGKATQTMYWKLKTGEVREAIQEKEGIGLYLCMPFHVSRVNMAMPDFSAWAQGLPEFELMNDELKFVGSLRSAHPYRAMVYDAVNKSNTLTYFQVNLPLWYTNRHWDKMILQIEESEKVFKEQFPTSRFVVVVWGMPPEHVDILEKKIVEKGIPHLFCRPELGKMTAPYRDSHELFLACGHPAPLMQELLARFLVDRLLE